MPNKICEKCNQVLTDDAAFCSNCGSPQKKQELEVVDLIYKQENFASNDKSKSFLSYTGAKILSLLVIISLMITVFAINNINQANEKIEMQEVSIEILAKEIISLKE